MYAIVLATALTTGGAAPDLHHRGGCYGCYGGNAFSSCYGCYGCNGCYGGGWISSCYGCYGCYGSGFASRGSCCGGCWGASYSTGGHGCYGSCYGSGFGGGWASFEAYGGFGGCGGCFGGCFGGCTGYYGGASPTYFAPMAGAPRTMAPAYAAASGSEAAATVIVKAPMDATVTVNGQATTRTTAEQTFQTPGLAAGKSYAYKFEASLEKDGKVVRATKSITVAANSRTVVDFSDLASEKATAKVTVVLPKGAKLYVNDVAYTGEGKQTFDTPKLPAGKKYFYNVRAVSSRDGQAVSETRRITVEAGKEVTVDFTATSAAVRTASR